MLVQEACDGDQCIPCQRFIRDQAGVDGVLRVVNELLRLTVDEKPVRWLPTDPLALAAQIAFCMADARTEVLRFGTRQLGEHHDNLARGVVRGIEIIHDGDQTASGLLHVVQHLADLADALTGETVQLPDDKRADGAGRSRCQRRVETTALNGLVTRAPSVHVDLANGQPVALGPCPAVGFLPFNGGLAVAVQ